MKIYSEGWERKYGGEQQRGKIYGGNKEEQIGDREVREKKRFRSRHKKKEENEDKQIKIRPTNVT